MREYFRFKEVGKLLRRKPSAPHPIKVCPVCLHDNLKTQLNPFLGLLSAPMYSCENCGYRGPIYAEIDLEEYIQHVNLVNNQEE
ncbi:MAG: hypothetical protein ACTSW1_19235 [Candidatus Hodarchaeales archaeon]